MRLTMLIEDGKPAVSGLETEHGLAVLVEADGQLGLFDTGQSDAVCRNAERLGVDLGRLDWIVLSHGHYDHTGGLHLKAASEFQISLRVFCMAIYCLILET